MLTRPKYYLNDEERERLKVVRATYERARQRGDENVYFISGSELLLLACREGALVDNCHPTDLGFFSMATVIEEKLSQMIL